MVLDEAGCRAVLTSAGAEAACLEAAQDIARRACAMTGADSMTNPPFNAHSSSGGERAHARAHTSSKHGRRAQAKGNILQKSI